MQKITVLGASGRMGQANIHAIARIDGAALFSALERDGVVAIGKDARALAGLEPSGVLITSDVDAALDGTDAIIDFTAPQVSIDYAKKAHELGLVHVIGTTGWTREEDEEIAALTGKGRLVKAGNMSLGVNLLMGLVKKAAAALPEDFDIEVLEMHHRMKVDAPSGTALMLGEAAAEGRQIDLAENAVRSRDGITGARKPGNIGFATLRGGTVIGDHSVIFAGSNERIELSHSAQDRSIFANGAIHASLWAQDKAPGLYSMADVLGL
ncbi:4-hydroxy-tetrahydrodipicolinate reductase [Maritalea porphyrae]|uniref:4-hydroxy-tetrahydrodipicolinate reductase n=1 Tax=Maritalea porphyrae TaxID=880732 RepID=UPI0022AE9DF6|nr:4-hydroxy-tetrahydrodipicolinate reductase [Maritalea porphyrae]MCZ4272228.1 4-hydroxy-tetrahydrodipicolinate reductase [Maritalea porphyrae]